MLISLFPKLFCSYLPSDNAHLNINFSHKHFEYTQRRVDLDVNVYVYVYQYVSYRLYFFQLGGCFTSFSF